MVSNGNGQQQERERKEIERGKVPERKNYCATELVFFLIFGQVFSLPKLIDFGH